VDRRAGGRSAPTGRRGSALERTSNGSAAAGLRAATAGWGNAGWGSPGKWFHERLRAATAAGLSATSGRSASATVSDRRPEPAAGTLTLSVDTDRGQGTTAGERGSAGKTATKRSWPRPDIRDIIGRWGEGRFRGDWLS